MSLSIGIIEEDKINNILFERIEILEDKMVKLSTKSKNRNLLKYNLRNSSKSKEILIINTIEDFDFSINDYINL